MTYPLKWLYGALLLISSQVAGQPITVEIGLTPPVDATVGLRGDTAPLTWDRSTPMLDHDGDGFYDATVEFAQGSAMVAYKVVIETADGEVTWEEGSNRVLLPGRMRIDRRRFGEAQSGLPMHTLTPAELDKDLSVLWESLTALHPGLALHNSPKELDRVREALRRQATGLKQRYSDAIPMSAVYQAVAEAVAAIKDGHTQVSMYNQGAYLTATLYARADRAPFSFRLIRTRMVVTGDATPDQVLPPGTEILSMDGRPIPEVIDALLPFASADGSNDPKRLDELGVNGVLGPAERFDVIYSLLFEPTGPLELTVRRPGEAETDLTVERTTRDARREILWNRDANLPRSNDDLLSSRMLNDSTAYLHIGSFATFSMSINYEAWLLKAFKKFNASGAANLVVDLRDVAGGMDDAASLLLRHLLQKPITVSPWQNHTAYQRVPDALRPYLKSWNAGLFDLTDQVTASADGQFMMSPNPDVTLRPSTDAFKGSVGVLIDATASSATFYLAKAIKENGVAPLVGQETGGSLKGLNAGLMTFVTLPYSGIVIDVPLMGARPTEPGPDRGIRPDILVIQDFDAIVVGRDLELEAALALFTAER